jgi:hypothetical protein
MILCSQDYYVTPQFTLYEPHTAEESLRRHTSGRHNQVRPYHAGQARELLHVLFPTHQRVCVKWHMEYTYTGIAGKWQRNCRPQPQSSQVVQQDH